MKYFLAMSLIVLGIPFAHATRVVLPAPRMSLESPELNASLEKRGESWLLTSFKKSSKQTTSKRLREPSEISAADTAYGEIRDWAIEIMPNLKVDAKCQDIKVNVRGAMSRDIALCSKIQAHRVFASSFYSRILAVSR